MTVFVKRFNTSKCRKVKAYVTLLYRSMTVVTGIAASVHKYYSMPVRLRHCFLLAVFFVGSFIILSMNKTSEYVFLNNDIRHRAHSDAFDERYAIKTKGCTMPAMRYLGEEVKKFVKYPNKIQSCPDSSLALLASNRTHIWVRNKNKDHYTNNSDSTFDCCYRSFHRPLSIQDITATDNDNRVKYSDCIRFENFIDVTDEFVKVECNIDNIKVYQQYFVFTPKKKLSDDIPINKNAYNVVVMGIDAVSRLNFHRTMPNTLSFLKDNGAVELFGYNKVGDNTFPNLIPMLMGFSEQDLRTTCTPNEKSSFDNCPLIWEHFKHAGYYTAFGEDSSSLGTFNYLQTGFIGNPTDYYLHTFINEAEKNVGVNKDFNSFLCMNDRHFYEVLLDYIENLTFTLSTSKLFGFFWEVTMSHDYLNYPMLMDNDYTNFFKRLNASGYLKESILFLVSDHGIRWGEIRSTNQGRLEERLPFVYILTPPTFRKKYHQAYDNLKLNRYRLTTPYDIHATLLDLTNLEHIENQKIAFRVNQSYARHSKGITLFLPIPDNRTCAMANIDDHWCSCHRGEKMSSKGTQAEKIAGQLVQELNLMLHDYSQCAQLKLSEVLEITEMKIGSPDIDFLWKEYMVVIRTVPGNAVFEGTLRNNTEKWSLAGTISRLNLYGSQSRCVENHLLKLYCYCN